MSLLTDLLWLIFFLGAALQLPRFFLPRHYNKYGLTFHYLILFHFVLGGAFFLFTRNGGGDAWGYWVIAQQMSYGDFLSFVSEGEGTRFMEALNFIPANMLGMSFFANTMLYSFLGSAGLCCFLAIALETVPVNKVLAGYAVFPLLFFLPNLHFWSAGVGKDTMLFMSVGMLAYGLMSPIKRIPLIILALFFALSIRPHVALFLLLGFGVAYLFDGKVSTTQRTLLSVLLLGGGAVLLPQVLGYIKLESLDVSAISDRAGTQAEGLARASGSGVDISGYPLPLKIVTFLYRPLFFDARSFGTLLSSLDNLMLLLLSWHAFRFRPLETFRMAPFVLKGFLLFGIIGTLAFSISLGNLGVMVRMKNMFTPGILIYFMWCYSYRFQFEYAQKKAAENVKKLRLKMKAKKGENKPVTE